MKIQFKKLDFAKLKAEFILDDGFFLITGKIILTDSGYMVSLPSQAYQDKDGLTKYKALVKVSGDKSRWFKFNEWVLEQANKQGVLDAPQSEPDLMDDLPF